MEVKSRLSYASMLKKGINNKDIIPKITPKSDLDIYSSESVTSSSTESSPILQSQYDYITLKDTFNLSQYSSESEEYDFVDFNEFKLIKNTTISMTDCKLPGGKRYQKDGGRLEKAFFNSLPNKIKNNVSVNIKPMHPNGNAIVEFDMLYRSDSLKRIISFEIKGANKKTIDSIERQDKLIYQGLRQKKYLSETFENYTIDNIYCFVTGKNKDFEGKKNSDDSEWKCVISHEPKKTIDNEFLKRLKQNGFFVAIGETPQHCVKKALFILELLR